MGTARATPCARGRVHSSLSYHTGHVEGEGEDEGAGDEDYGSGPPVFCRRGSTLAEEGGGNLYEVVVAVVHSQDRRVLDEGP